VAVEKDLGGGTIGVSPIAGARKGWKGMGVHVDPKRKSRGKKKKHMGREKKGKNCKADPCPK